MAPPAKHPSTRQRRNRPAVTARTLVAVKPGDEQTPDLPEHADGWHSQTLAWWRDVWASPMAPEFDDSDRHGLFVLAVLVDGFWKAPSKELAAEIRLQRQCFGLTPIDRRRLQWEIDRGEEAEQKTVTRRAASKPRVVSGKDDPRRALA